MIALDYDDYSARMDRGAEEREARAEEGEERRWWLSLEATNGEDTMMDLGFEGDAETAASLEYVFDDVRVPAEYEPPTVAQIDMAPSDPRALVMLALRGMTMAQRIVVLHDAIGELPDENVAALFLTRGCSLADEHLSTIAKQFAQMLRLKFEQSKDLADAARAQQRSAECGLIALGEYGAGLLGGK